MARKYKPQHLERLDNSLGAIHLDNPMDFAAWTELLLSAIDKADESYAALYVQVTRGADTKRDFVYPSDVPATIFIMVNPAPILDRGEAQNVKPYEVVTLEDFRWANGQIKTISLIAAGMLKNEAIRRGANEAVLIKDGKVTECSSSNLFAVFDGVLVTPPKSCHLLHGITRDEIIELSIKAGLSVEEREIDEEELATADELFLTSSTHESWPISKLNGKTIGNGEPGLVWRQVDALFQAHKISLNLT